MIFSSDSSTCGLRGFSLRVCTSLGLEHDDGDGKGFQILLVLKILINRTVPQQQNNEQMLRLCTRSNRLTLRCFHLDELPRFALRVVTFGRARKKYKVIVVSPKDSTQAADEMTVRGERALGEMFFKLGDELVESLDDPRYFPDGIQAVSIKLIKPDRPAF